MNKTFGLLFYLKKSKVDAQGKCPIYLRITIDGKRTEISTKRTIEIEKWSVEANKAIGRTEDIRELNAYLDSLTTKVYQSQRDLIQDNKEVTTETLKNKFLGVEEKQRTLITIFKNHNKQVEKLVGREFSAGTLERYKTVCKHLKEFMQHQYKVSDIPVNRIDHKYITDFEFYLKTVRNCGHNSTIKYIKNFKKIVRIAIANDWIKKDPFLNYKVRLKEVERQFLSEEEIQTMLEKELHTNRLEQVRDIFIFCCFTGLAYSDVKKLSKDNLVFGIDGDKWIKTKRTKTDTRSNIPLLPTALEIIKKYENHPEAVTKGVLLPVLSNQKSNAYLKEIADLCGINKNLTTHLARHTFATTVTLSNGVPMESVSKMLGHKSLKTTQHYAKILDRKVSDDMAILKQKFADKSNVDASKRIAN
ncbi:site-specific integrase [Winogradskyella sp. DF17]|uniref:Site-specific integrase n=1 Tax=Winogradskyella pelagia TaxID=2819984 RepID=A0ABS3T1A8_9FLAO|nr:site-specific integrase [Winogradskyella sp. DF17]MBO3116522.1 site-specific integrase [Winogradskyella sp. DF17]